MRNPQFAAINDSNVTPVPQRIIRYKIWRKVAERRAHVCQRDFRRFLLRTGPEESYIEGVTLHRVPNLKAFVPIEESPTI
jgi:hypothetical protein